MPLPAAPIVYVLMRYAIFAALVLAAARAAEGPRRDQKVEDALDDLPEGLAVNRDGEAVRMAGRTQRVIRLGTRGPGVALDFAGIARLRMRRV